MNLTKRQEAFWRKKMIDLEMRLIAYYDRNPQEKPDGSFLMSAFKSGWYAAQRLFR